MKIPNVPNTSVKLMLFPFSLEGAARIWLEKEPPRSIETWDDLVSQFINKFFPPSKTTNLRNEITRFQQKFDETFYEAWDRFNDLLRGCPHHGFIDLRSSTVVNQPVSHQGPAPQNTSVSRTDFERYVTAQMMQYSSVEKHANQSQTCNPNANLTDMLSKFVTDNTASTSALGTLPRTKGYQDVEVQRTDAPADNGCTEDVQPPVSLSINSFPSRRNDERRKEKANDQIEKFYEIFRDLSFEISFTDALMLMPKFASTLKTLIGNKEKLSELARTPLNENCSAVILNKLPKKLGDPGRFLIPCEFTGITTCNALAIMVRALISCPLFCLEDLALLNYPT
ncbi:reverse transcriptase domain-containing protein [Tanacetum coccineum]